MFPSLIWLIDMIVIQIICWHANSMIMYLPNHVKVVPQFVNAKLVNISPISLGLIIGSYLYAL